MDRVDALRGALERRGALLTRWEAEDTDAYRLLHGAVEEAPGTAVDRYGDVLLVQTWREPLAEGELDALAEVASQSLGTALRAVWNHRSRGTKGTYARWHDVRVEVAEARELGLTFDARPRHRGKDPLLFLDFRAGRRKVRAAARGKEVLNLFAYTCGIGVAAAAGGAARVVNVDFAASALEVGRENAVRNGVEQVFETLQADALPTMRQLAGLPPGGRRGGRRPKRVAPHAFDVVVLDPPRWATSRFGAVDLVRDYPGVLKPALLATKPGGQLLVTNNVASVDVEDWLEVVRRCGSKCGREVHELEVITPEEDFPSPDGRHPLKMAWLQV